MGKNVLVLLLFVSLISLSLSTNILFAQSPSAAQFHSKGVEEAKLGNYETASLYFDKALEIEPDNILYLNNKGFALIGEEKYYEAFVIFGKVLKIEPDDANALIGYPLAKSTMFAGVDGIADIIIRDSNGYLVGYLRTTNIGILNSESVANELKSLLEAEDYAQIEINVNLHMKVDTAITQTSFAPEGMEVPLFTSKHPAYPVTEGDTVTAHFTIVND